MTSKADFTQEEWAGLVRAPVLAGGYVVVADMSTFGMIGEMRGLYAAISEGPIPEAAADLIGAIVADIKASDESGDGLSLPEVKNSATAGAQLLHQLSLDLEPLDRTAARDESVAFKEWLVGLAEATAEAGKEGGFLGVGAVRVSDKERDALVRLRSELGLY
jgi:hypothetical protein